MVAPPQSLNLWPLQTNKLFLRLVAVLKDYTKFNSISVTTKRPYLTLNTHFDINFVVAIVLLGNQAYKSTLQVVGDGILNLFSPVFWY